MQQNEQISMHIAFRSYVPEEQHRSIVMFIIERDF